MHRQLSQCCKIGQVAYETRQDEKKSHLVGIAYHASFGIALGPTSTWVARLYNQPNDQLRQLVHLLERGSCCLSDIVNVGKRSVCIALL